MAAAERTNYLRNKVVGALLAGISVLTLSSSLYAQTNLGSTAQASALNFSVSAGSLENALLQLGRQANLRIVYPSEMTRGKHSSGVIGNHSPQNALAKVLSGSGLNYSFTDANTVTISNGSTGASAPIDASGSTLLDTITVSGGKADSLEDAPYQTAGSSTYISGEKIERFRGTSVGDMLSGTPGVLNADNRNGAALDVNIRGMQGQGRVPVSVDGAIQETTVYRGYSGIAGRSYVDPDFIGGVMIEKGPSSAADGAGVIGGIVRMNTITVDDILRPGKNFGLRIKGGFNSNSSAPPAIDTQGGYWGGGIYPSNAVPTSFGGTRGLDRPSLLEPTGGSGSIAGAFRSEHVDLVAAYARRKNGNYFAGTGNDAPTLKFFADCGGSVSSDGCSQVAPGMTGVAFEGVNRYRAGEEVLNTSQDNASILLKGTLRLPDEHEFDLSYMRYESKYGEIMPSQIIYFGGQGPYQGKLNEVVMDTYTSRYKWNPEGNDLINLKAGLWMTDAELKIPTQFYREADPSLLNAYGTKNRRWGFNAENRSEFDTAWGGLSLNYGGSYTYETIEPGEGADWRNSRFGNRQEVSLFTAGQWKPSDWLTLDASLRYSDFKSTDKQPQIASTVEYRTISDGNGGTIEMTTAEYALLPRPRPTTISTRYVYTYRRDDRNYQGDGFAPMFSATVEPWQGFQFYGKYAEAIRLPSLFETTRGFSTVGAMPGLGLGLKPEHAKTWELGLNVLKDDVFTGGDKLRLKASYFDNRVNDYITRTSLATGPGGTAPIVNIDYAELRGIELQASYDMGRFFGDLAYTHYTHTNFCNRPENVNPGTPFALCNAGGTENSYVVNQLPPKDSLSLTLGARAFEEKLTVGGRVTYVGDRGIGGVLSDSMNSGGGTIELVKWEPYTLVDLFASYKVNEQFQVDAAIDNVADVYYMDTLTLGLMPSPGRTFRMNMTAKF
ncbi:TonB-dependent receptor domain-containing protein [Brucella pseudogrignonensis]|uniref:TonB-dependent receptor n=1 Tax=Brucella pseudogrignonensis TaxID=419475 RepID=UPI00286C60D3|nr:TonB-dependent receptor [Brucella pseudogrignonensis]